MDVERSPFILPPVPKDFIVSADGQINQIAPTPAGGMPVQDPDQWLDGYIRHFSPSSIRMLKVCPEQYRQRYILGKKERPGEALTLGSSVHAAMAFNLEQKIESHEDLPEAEVLEYFHDQAWPAAIESDGGKDEIRW